MILLWCWNWYMCAIDCSSTNGKPSFLLIISYHASKFISFSNWHILWLKLSQHCSGYLADANANKPPGWTKQIRKRSITCGWSNEVQEQSHFLFYFNSFPHLCILQCQFWFKFFNKKSKCRPGQAKVFVPFLVWKLVQCKLKPSTCSRKLRYGSLDSALTHYDGQELTTSPFSSKTVQCFCGVFPWKGSHSPPKRKW